MLLHGKRVDDQPYLRAAMKAIRELRSGVSDES